MSGSGWPGGVERVLLDEIDSTNAEAARRAASTTAPVWIAARRQTAGRGRSGRAWSTGEGNLAATLLFRSARPPAERARFSFHAALAVADVLERFVPGAEVRLKWPNDALLGGRKVAGILLESFGAPAAGGDLAIGIGLNLARHPPEAETRWPATSIAAATGGEAPGMEEALEALAAALAAWIARDEAEGFAAIRAAWLARAAMLGEAVEARMGTTTESGIFEDVDETGALVLNTGAGRRVIAAADIHFPA